MQNDLPTTGFLRLRQIVGDPKAGISPLIPLSRSTWWAGVRSGRFPSPVRSLGKRVTVWRVEDIRKLIESCAEQEGT